jgi:hypothetical protein
MKKRFLAGMITLLLCISACIYAVGEVHSENTEANGKIKETVWKDDSGQIAAGPEGYAIIRYTYKGAVTTEQYYDTEGQPFEVPGGYYGRSVTKDKGNVTEIVYLDQNARQTANRMGYSKVSITYFGFGEVRSITYFGTNKKPVMVPSLGYASVKNEYIGKLLKSKTYCDTKGNAVDGAQGYAIMKQNIKKVGGSNQVLSTRYFHADETDATGPDGWCRCVKERDEKGRITSIKYYDTAGRLTDRGANYAWEAYSYEEGGTVRITRYDLSDSIVTDKAGVATLVQETKDDKIVRERFLDKEGNRANNDLGVGQILYSYDTQGRIEKVTYQDTEGNPVKCSKGYAGYQDTKDEDGITVSRVFLGTDGLAIEIPGGYSEIRYQYDETKALVSVLYYDINGKQVQGQ